MEIDIDESRVDAMNAQNCEEKKRKRNISSDSENEENPIKKIKRDPFANRLIETSAPIRELQICESSESYPSSPHGSRAGTPNQLGQSVTFGVSIPNSRCTTPIISGNLPPILPSTIANLENNVMISMA